ncbi:uncharacterized protein LAJ45_11716 [Morchella importuna]|uniref:uncharacterized protein n=1 Tax=Morchella importuna TaxID=1174673 RepID=UPI001E8D5FD5|nr:uncharacterized protein LAJ45_11716 [Morchella importuna]KAH8144320.1 hypothetical protein LAJ45_11716 [Morchella importuna]
MIGVLHAPCILCHAPLHFRRTTRHGVTLGRLFMRLGTCIMRSKGDRSSVSTARGGGSSCALRPVSCAITLSTDNTARRNIKPSLMRLGICIMRSKGVDRPSARHGKRFFMRLASCVMRHYTFDGQHGTA